MELSRKRIFDLLKEQSKSNPAAMAFEVEDWNIN